MEFITDNTLLYDKWECYVDDAIVYVESEAIENVLYILKHFIDLASEQESNKNIFFLDVFILRNGNSFEATVQRLSNRNNIY